jgi:hypothetical protein
MSDGMLDILTKLITSPPALFVAGGLIFGTIYKLSEGLEKVLTEDAKLQIAIWLLDVKQAEKRSSGPERLRKSWIGSSA